MAKHLPFPVQKMLSVLVIDESQGRAAEICAGLAVAGYQVAALVPDTLDLSDQVQRLSPDVILIQTESPSRDTLEHLAVLGRNMPRPVLMFAKDSDSSIIREAMRAGVSAYVVDGLHADRIQPLVEVAMARFEEYRELKRERDEATRKLTDRITVDRAKGVLMKARGLDEDGAYNALRKLAMDRGQPLQDVASDVLAMAKILL
ncbi:MAG TPA: ANTAR domain-containing protein [Rhodocyclaceae bacterium]|jgi:response regulator NasT|nr:ANTAR domain-containing protein [Rhodocyclaceae bacterium]